MANRTRRISAPSCVLLALVGVSLTACGGSGGTGDTGTGGSSTGGRVGSGGIADGTGGTTGSGGSTSTGGATGSGGVGTGGKTESGGTTGSGGQTSSGGATGNGGTTGSGGTVASGGSSGGAGRAGGGTTGGGGRMGVGGRGGTTASGGTTGSGGTGAGAGSSGTCQHMMMKGTDICTIGDSWIQITGGQVTTLENHMAMAGVIGQGEHFDRREVSGSTLSSIIGTYTRKPMNCKILVMDGGGIDLFSTPLDPNSSAVKAIVQQFTDFLQTLKKDGYVQHVIYSLYPIIPMTKNLNGNMKPGFSAACAASPVDCHLVDLEPLFKGQHFGSDNTHADATGSTMIGDAWWKAMQENCIAQ